MRSATRIAVAAALLAAPDAVRAQGPERIPARDARPHARQSLEPGARVRVTVSLPSDHPAARSGPLTGRLVRLDADSVLVATDERVVSMPRSGLATLEMPDGSVSRGRAARRGAGVGGTIGFVGGAVLGYLAYEPCTSMIFCFSREGEAMLAGAVAGTLGVVIGGVVGAARGGERWRQVPLDPGTRVGLALAPRGVGIAVRF